MSAVLDEVQPETFYLSLFGYRKVLSRNYALTTEHVGRKKRKGVLARGNSSRNVHNQNDIGTRLGWISKNVDVLCMKGEIYEKGDEIGGIDGKICSLQKDKTLYDMNEEKIKLVKNEMSYNNFKKVTGFDASYTGKVKCRLYLAP